MYEIDDSPVKPQDVLPDRPHRGPAKDWLDYKINYQATFAAQLMYPAVDTYEVMPWPDRIYQDYTG